MRKTFMRCTCLLPFLGLALALGLAGEARADTIYEFIPTGGGPEIATLDIPTPPAATTGPWSGSFAPGTITLTLSSPFTPPGAYTNAGIVTLTSFTGAGLDASTGTSNNVGAWIGPSDPTHTIGVGHRNPSLDIGPSLGSDEISFSENPQEQTVGDWVQEVDVPELDPGSAVSAMALLASGLAMWGGRRRRSAPRSRIR
jgi:hypothetical protein